MSELIVNEIDKQNTRETQQSSSKTSKKQKLDNFKDVTKNETESTPSYSEDIS